MHTIKVDVENCIECGFWELECEEDPTQRLGNYCALALAIDLVNGGQEGVCFDEERDDQPGKAPEWCPAREGVRVEKSCSQQ